MVGILGIAKAVCSGPESDEHAVSLTQVNFRHIASKERCSSDLEIICFRETGDIAVERYHVSVRLYDTSHDIPHAHPTQAPSHL